MAGSITSANAVLMLTIPNLFQLPQRIQGWAADDAFGSDAVTTGDTVMGVDGGMSYGYVPAITPLTLHLQADSASLSLFEDLDAAEQTIQEKYAITGQLSAT